MTPEQRTNIQCTAAFFRQSHFWNGGFNELGSRHGVAIADALQAILDFQPEKPFDNGKPEWLGGF